MRIEGVYPILFVTTEDEADAASAMAAALLREGCGVLQLRARGISDAITLALAKVLAKQCREAEALFLVNDRVDIAHLSDAHGVHLGHDDLPPEEARRLLGQAAIIGRSTDSPGEAAAMALREVDYIAWGAVFPTGTKPDAARQRGPAALGDVRAAIPAEMSLVAIGGIELDNIAEVAAGGADAAAVISALRDASDPGRAFRELSEEFARGAAQRVRLT